jgi:hypothetical protein
MTVLTSILQVFKKENMKGEIEKRKKKRQGGTKIICEEFTP